MKHLKAITYKNVEKCFLGKKMATKDHAEFCERTKPPMQSSPKAQQTQKLHTESGLLEKKCIGIITKI